MNHRFDGYAWLPFGLSLAMLAGPVWAQQTPQQSSRQPAAQEARQPAPQENRRPPFQLTPQEEAQVETILKRWEEHNKTIKTFDCRFERWTYDMVFGQPNAQGNMPARFDDVGCLRYVAPESLAFQVDATKKTDGTEVPIDGNRAEHWVCDGKSIFEFKHLQKKLIEHQLPPEGQGKTSGNPLLPLYFALVTPPLSFFFGTEATTLKERYWIRVLPKDAQNQIWLEAWPKDPKQAACFKFAQFIIDSTNINPFGLLLMQPNGKDYTTYQFWDVVVNDRSKIFKLSDPLNPSTPRGWTKIVEPAVPVQPQGQPPAAD